MSFNLFALNVSIKVRFTFHQTSEYNPQSLAVLLLNSQLDARWKKKLTLKDQSLTILSSNDSLKWQQSQTTRLKLLA